jgi:hypothetical protein
MKHLAQIVTQGHHLHEDLFQHCMTIALERGMQDNEDFFFSCSETNGVGANRHSISFIVLTSLNSSTNQQTTSQVITLNHGSLNTTYQQHETIMTVKSNDSLKYTLERGALTERAKQREYILTRLKNQ